MKRAVIAILIATFALGQLGCGRANSSTTGTTNKPDTNIEKETEKEISINADNLIPSQVILNNKIVNWDTTFKEFIDQLNFDPEVYIGYEEYVELNDAYSKYHLPKKSIGEISIHSKNIDLIKKVGVIGVELYNDTESEMSIADAKVNKVKLYMSGDKIHSGITMGEQIDEEETSDKFTEVNVNEDKDTYKYRSNDISMTILTSDDGVNTVILEKIMESDGILDIGNIDEFIESDTIDEDMAEVDWKSGKIKINDTYITLPCKVSDIIEASDNTIKISETTLENRPIINSNNAMYIDLVESAGSNIAVCGLRLENRSEQEVNIQDAEVYGISVTDILQEQIGDSTKFEVVYPKSLRLRQVYTIEQLEELLGNDWIEPFGQAGSAWREESENGTYSQLTVNTDSKNKVLSLNIEIGCKDLWVQA